MARSLWLLLALAGCAAERGERPEPELGPADRSLDSAIAEVVSRDRAGEAESRRLTELGARWQPKTIGEPPPVERPLGRRERVTVRFANAELEEALRLLADAGGFAMIADGDLAGRVNADLRQVRPYEALVSLAEAHGARVERRGAIVVVTPR
ncbi:MAG: hypothetical protein HS104_35810 [Polyangiaceae bacterium]|nr:hypothetical protein [Polyangiaceae bacterium]MCL4750381.1 hypothetical protein [Myxococcales bacterium]